MAFTDARQERAFVATCYLLGERNFEHAPLGAAGRALVLALASPSRDDRALALAAEVSKIVLALERSALQ